MECDTGVEIGVLSYRSTKEDLREFLYDKLKLSPIKSRISKLKEDIIDRCELTKKLYEKIGLHLINSTIDRFLLLL